MKPMWASPMSTSALLVLFAITALAVYGVALAGWASNSKYSLLGGLRSSAQMISYELALTLSVVGVLLIAGDFSLRGIIDHQTNGSLGMLGWNIFGFPEGRHRLHPDRRIPLLLHRGHRGNQPRALSTSPKQNRNWSLVSTPNTPA